MMSMTHVRTIPLVFRDCSILAVMVSAIPILLMTHTPRIFAQDLHIESEKSLLDSATEAWLNGAAPHALDILEQGLREDSSSLALRKLRGDILTTTRRNQQALETYEAILNKFPKSLAVRWAKWSVFTRLGQGDLAINEFKRLAQHTPTNPLVPLRLAQALRKLDRLEESVEWYQKAVDLVPEMSGWRLNLARALFDVLQYDKARKEVQQVLKNLLLVDHRWKWQPAIF